MFGIRFTGSFRLRIVTRVVIAIGQSEPTLNQLRNHLRRILKILTRAKAKDRRNTMQVEQSNLVLEAEQIRNPSNPLQLGFERLDALGFDPWFVHARGVEVGDLLLVGVCRLSLKQSIQDVVQHVYVLLAKLGEPAPD